MELLAQDDAVFSDPAFDCYAWVEEALIESSGSGGGSSSDVGALAQLVPRLSLLSQSLAQAIHAALHQLSLSGPQLEAQLAAMQQATAPLAAQLDAVHADISAAGSAAGGGAKKQQRERDLEHLVALHDAKQRLTACSQALVEAARWGKNARACVALVDDPLFMDQGRPPPPAVASRRLGRRGQDQDKDAAPATLAECVREMRASLEILKDMPGARDRKQTMDRHIESKMRTKLDRFLRDEHVDVAQLQWCLEVFDSMGRADEVRRAFCKSRPAGVHRVWFAFDQQQQQQIGASEDGEDKSASAAFSAWLDGFYGDVERMVQRESAAARELFGERDAVVGVALELLENTLAPLAESFRDRLRRDFHMAHALRAFQSTSAFAAVVVRLFRALETGESGALESSLGALAVSLPAPLLAKEGEQQHTSEELGSKLLSTIFEPFRAIFDEYARFASSTLTDQLLRLVPSFVKRPTGSAASRRTDRSAADEDEDDDFMADDADDALLEVFAQKLEDASSAVWGLVEESLQQCYAFTAGAAFPEAVEAAAVAVQQFSLALTSSVPAMRKYCNAEASGGTTSDVTAMVPPDWSKFHGALALLKACGALESDLCAMENRVRARMREQLTVFVGGAAGTSGGGSSPRSRRKKSHDASATALSALADPLQIAAAVSRLWLRESPLRLSQFQQFAHEQMDAAATASAADGSVNLFDDAQRSVREWTREAQRLTFDTVFLPIARVLDALPVMGAWSEAPAEEDGDLPTFSALPQEYITVVADRLLSLLPQLEPFAESSGLQQAFLASRGAHDVCVQDEWQRLGKLLRLTAQETLECQRVFTEDAGASEEGKDDGAVVTSATAFVDLWTAAVASGALAALLRAVCLISELSDAGARQLSADLGYFFNVLSAVGGEGSFLIEDLRASLELSAAEQGEHVAQLRAAAGENADQGAAAGNRRKLVLAKLSDCVAAKRQRAAERRGTSTANSTFY